jgi:hypothetical protein
MTDAEHQDVNAPARSNIRKADAGMDTAAAYERDFVGWTEGQAAILKSIPKSSFGLDTDNLAEEIADLGRSEIRETSSLLRQVLVHLIKLAMRPRSEPADHWVEEVLAFQGDAVLACTPGMRQRIDVPHIWKLAGNAARRSLELRGANADNLPAECPFSLDELLVADFDPIAAAAKLAASINAASGDRKR